MDSYRFLSGEEPSDEQLAQIMREVAEEAKAKHQQVTEAYFAEMRRNAKIKRAKWANCLNRAANGNL